MTELALTVLPATGAEVGEVGAAAGGGASGADWMPMPATGAVATPGPAVVGAAPGGTTRSSWSTSI